MDAARSIAVPPVQQRLTTSNRKNESPKHRLPRVSPIGGVNSTDRSVLLQDSDMRVYGNVIDVARKPHGTRGQQKTSKVAFYQDLRQMTTPKSTYPGDPLAMDKKRQNACQDWAYGITMEKTPDGLARALRLAIKHKPQSWRTTYDERNTTSYC